MAYLLLGFVMMGSGIIHLVLRPLSHLGIAYPPVLSYAHLLAPAAAAVLWFSLRRRLPVVSAVVALLLCWLTINGVVGYAESRLDKVAATRFLTEEERQSLTGRLGFPVWEQASSGRGHEIFVRRGGGRVERVTDELRRMGVLRDREGASGRAGDTTAA